jgi:cytochrome c553
MPLNRMRQRRQVDALARVRGHLDGLQAQALQRLQRAIERGRLDDDRIARPRHRAEAQVERLQRAVGDDDLVGRAPAGRQRDSAERSGGAASTLPGVRSATVAPRVERLGARRQRLAEPREREQSSGLGNAEPSGTTSRVLLASRMCPTASPSAWLACIACHGREGAPRNDGYYPRLAGKPAGYLYNQLRELPRRPALQRRHGVLVAHLSDAYLREIAEYFAARPALPAARHHRRAAATLARGKALVHPGRRGARHAGLRAVPRRGDDRRGAGHSRACWACRATICRPARRLEITGERHALAPDCMARSAAAEHGRHQRGRKLAGGVQPVPTGQGRRQHLPAPLPLPCGGMPRSEGAAMRSHAGPGGPARPAVLLAGWPSWRLNLRGEDPLPHRAAPVEATPEQVQRGSTSRAPATARAATRRAAAPLCRRRGIDTPFGTVFASNLTPDPPHRHRPLERRAFLARAAQRPLEGRAPALPRLPVPELHAGHARGLRRALRLPAQRAAGAPAPNRRTKLRFPV